MNTSKRKAIGLIDDKLDQFNYLLEQFNSGKQDRQEYENIYYETECLVEELFSKDKKKDFSNNVAPGRILLTASQSEKDTLYKNHLLSCISQLNAYKNTVEHFWGDDKVINWDVLNGKLQLIWTLGRKSWKGIAFLLGVIILIAGAINALPTVLDLLIQL